MDAIVGKIRSGVKIAISHDTKVKYDDLVTSAYQKSDCDSASAMLLSFDFHMTGKIATITTAPTKSSGFALTTGGVLPNIEILKEPSGVNCQHPGHLGGSRNLGVKSLICANCSYHTDDNNGTPPITALNTTWTLTKLPKIRSTRPPFIIVLVSRSSGDAYIPQKKFDQLRDVIILNERKIIDYLKEKNGLDYDIHIVQEIGISGSAMARISDCHIHLNNGGIYSHVTGNNLANIFFFYNAYKNAMFGVMSNSPGDFNGKISNHVEYLQQLREGGIEPGRVFFMSSGVEIVYNKNGTGVRQDFTQCSGEEMIQIWKLHNPKNSPPFSPCTAPNIYGYVYGMCDEATGRLVRRVNYRKSQVNKPEPGPAPGEEMEEDGEEGEEMEEDGEEGEEMEEDGEEGEEIEEDGEEGVEMEGSDEEGEDLEESDEEGEVVDVSDEEGEDLEESDEAGEEKTEEENEGDEM